MTANELRVVFERADGALKFRLELGADRGKARPFGFALSDGDHEDLRWYLESYMDLPDAGSRVRAHGVEARITGWGRGMYDALFDSEEGGRLLGRLRKSPAPRLLTIATDLGEVLRLPWELIADERRALFRQCAPRRRARGYARDARSGWPGLIGSSTTKRAPPVATAPMTTRPP